MITLPRMAKVFETDARELARSMGVIQRERKLHGTAEWLYEVLLRAIGCMLSAKAVAVPLLRRFAGVYLEDGSSVVLPDALERCWRGCRGGNGESRGDESGGQADAAAGSGAGDAAGADAARWTEP